MRADLSEFSTDELYTVAALAEGYTETPVDIDTFINDPYYLGQIYGDGGVYPYWVDALHKIYPNPIYSPYEEVCLSGDTEVDLLDGTTRTMAQICADGPDKVFWVLGYNPNTKEWEPCRAGAAKMTGVKPVYRVTLDNGKSFKATGNHKILGKDNRWHRVDTLKAGQSLMPYNLECDDRGYAWVWDNRTQKKVPRKRLVQVWKYPIPDGYHVHHKNQVKADDRPSNLMCLTRKDHFGLHNRLQHERLQDPVEYAKQISAMKAGAERFRRENPEAYKEACAKGGAASWKTRSVDKPELAARMREGQRAWMATAEGKAQSRAKLQQYHQDHPEEIKARLARATQIRWEDESQHLAAAERQRTRNLDPEFQKKARDAWRANKANIESAARRRSAGNANPEFQRKAHLGKILKGLNRDLVACGSLSLQSISATRRKAIARNFGCLDTEGKLDRAALEAKWPEILEQARNYNHRIVAIEELPPEPVFNFTVDILHSYPLSCGIVSSNCITGAIGVGKELSPNTLVVCKRGSVRACEVTMQDEVLGTDGKFHAILGIFPQEPHRFWTFTFNDGSTTTTGEDHIWTVSKYGPRSPHQRWFDTTTRDIVTGRVHGRYTGSGKYGSLYLPVLGAPVDYGDATCRSLPIPPYALGLLIADGCLTTGDVRLSNVEEDVQQRYLQALSAFGCELHYLGHNMYSTVPGGKIKAALNKMGLLCRAEEKHIPEEYLRASVEDRLALLQGYFDGDGCIEGPAKTIPTMSTTSKRLSDDLTQLVCSLGGRVTVSKRRGRYKLDGEWHECQDVYCLVITMPRGVRCFSSAKHTSRWHEPQNEVYKKIVRWEDAGVQQGVCFYVNTPNHLFAVDRYTFTHNTTVSLIGALYDLYHVTLLKDPHKKYKLLPTTSIIFSLVTATMDLATAVMANQFLDAMGASPYFCSKFNPKKGERLDEDMFAHHVGIGFGSRGGHNLGKAVIGAIIDEANFQDKVAGQAVDNYNTITRRMKSRFMLKGGTLPCRRWVISSRTDSAAFLESHIDAVRGKSNIIIFEPAIWDVQKVKGIYCGQTFPVFTGTTAEQPRILRTDEEVDNCAGYVIHVPVEYRDEFEEDLPKSLQDLAGVATRSGVNLIYDVEKLEESLCLDNCMATDEPHLTLKGQDQLIDYYKKPLPPGQYFVHLDGAKSGDRYGVAFSRVTEQISLMRTSAIDGTEYSKLSPKVETPLAFGIKALPGSQIPFFKVRQFLCDLRSQGVNIQYVSADGYQSVDMLQLLEKLGFKCGYESADRTKDPYLKLAENVVLGLHKMPKSLILKNELLNLQNLPNKVDHPLTIMVDGKQVKGGKDVADACCMSAFCAIGASLTLTQVNMIESMRNEPRQMSMKERQDFVLQNYFGFGM